MFNLLAITSRSGELARKIDRLSRDLEAQGHGNDDEGKAAQLNEAQNRQAALNDQLLEWDVSSTSTTATRCAI